MPPAFCMPFWRNLTAKKWGGGLGHRRAWQRGGAVVEVSWGGRVSEEGMVAYVLSVHRSAVSRPSDSSALKSRVRGEERTGEGEPKGGGVRHSAYASLVYVLLRIHDFHPSIPWRSWKMLAIGWVEEDVSTTKNPFGDLSSSARTGERGRGMRGGINSTVLPGVGDDGRGGEAIGKYCSCGTAERYGCRVREGLL